MKHWESVTIKPGECRLWELGPLCLWIRRIPDEYHVGYQRDPTQELRAGLGEEVEPPNDLEWQRYAAGSDGETVRVLPVMSDRPVIVRPDSPFSIPPATQAVFYVNIPLWLRIECLRPEPAELTTLPTVELSLSWFGTVTEGDLCYALRTSARRDLNQIPNRWHRAICQIKIRNRSEKLIPLQRICVAVSHLDIFQAGGRLWTNPISLTFKGDDQAESVVYGRKPTEQAGEAELLVPAREPPGRRLWRRSLDTLLKLGLG